MLGAGLRAVALQPAQPWSNLLALFPYVHPTLLPPHPFMLPPFSPPCSSALLLPLLASLLLPAGAGHE